MDGLQRVLFPLWRYIPHFLGTGTVERWLPYGHLTYLTLHLELKGGIRGGRGNQSEQAQTLDTKMYVTKGDHLVTE